LAGLILSLSAAALQGQVATIDAPFNVKIDTLTDAQAGLLLQKNYQIRDDGTVLAGDGSQPVTRGDMTYLLQRLESGQRLKALLQIDVILSSSEGEKNLTDDERESIRKVVKDNWWLFSLKTRRNFRSYFSLQELESMDMVPLPPTELEEPDLKDQEGVIEPVPAAPKAAAPTSVPAAAAAPAAPATVVAPAVAAPVAVATAAATVPAMTIAVPAAAVPSVPAPAAAVVPAAPVVAPAIAAPSVPAPAAISPAPTPVVAPAVAAPAVTAPPAAPAASAPRFVATPAAAVPAPAPAPAAPSAEPPLAEVTGAAFEKFLADAPYGREVKVLLRLVSERASFARNRVLNDVMTTMPQIVIEPDLVGEQTYSRLLIGPDGTITIALNNGAVLMEKPKLFLGMTTTLLPRSAKAYSEAGLPQPAVQALQGEAVPQRQASGPWGDASVYSDESQRASFTPEVQAGALLAELVRLDSRLRGWDASPYVTEIAARTAQWLLYDALAYVRRGDAFMDPLTRIAYHRWLTQPAAYHDELLLSLTVGRNRTVDPRKIDLAAVSEFDRRALADCMKASAEENAYRDASARQARTLDLAAYEASGLFSSEILAAARAAAAKAPAEPAPKTLCRPEWASEMAAISKSGVMLSEAVDAEKHLRQEKESHVDKE
jgi:hypothetical protein